MVNSILIKIQKLAAKAESCKEIGNITEAAIFSAKVSELLTLHNLAMADLDFEDQSEVEGVKYSDLGVTSKQGRWTVNLMSILCEFNFCDSVFHTSFKNIRYNSKGRPVRVKDKNLKVTIIGRPENVEVVKYLYSLLKNQFEVMSVGAWKTYIKGYQEQILKLGYSKTSSAYKQPWKSFKQINTKDKIITSFYLGAAQGIRSKLTEQMNEAKANYGSKITDLVLVNDNAIGAYMEQHHGKLGSFRNSKRSIDGAAYNKGREAGRNASMAKGVATGQTVSTKMINS